jgi:hypothetical protein
MQNEERINGLENQVRTLKRIVYGFGCLLVAGIVVAAQTPDKTKEEDKIMKVQLVGPITVDGIDSVVNHTVKYDGGMLPIDIVGGVNINLPVRVEPTSRSGFKITDGNIF